MQVFISLAYIPRSEISQSVALCVNLSTVSNSLQLRGLQPIRLLCPWNSPGTNTGVDSHSLLWGIFPTQVLNLGLPHCRWILYCLSHLESPKCNSMFNLLRNHPTVFLKVPSSFQILTSNLQAFLSPILTLTVCLSSYSHPRGTLSFILEEWTLIVLSICISLVTNGVEHLFMLIGYFVHCLWRSVYSSFCSYFSWVWGVLG